MKMQLSVKKIWRAAPCALVLFWAQASPAEVAFTLVTDGDIANDPGHYFGVAWGDYDADGFVDLFAGNTGTQHSLYHNNGDGSFSRVLTGAIAEDTPASGGMPAWADFDNDGDLDLLVPNWGGVADRFFRNEGDGVFTNVIDTWISASERRFGNSCCWGDLDKDGFVDLYVANTGGGGDSMVDVLYRNNGDGTMTAGDISFGGANGNYVTHLSVMSDIDMDGDADVLRTQYGLCVGENCTYGMVYLNDGNGSLIHTYDVPPIARGWWEDIDISPADYDNDGDLDLAVVGYRGNRTYLNNGMGVFTEGLDNSIFSVPQYPINDYLPAACAAWGDYDNDGRLDLFIARSEVQQVDFTDLLYHNEGNGEFSKVTGIPLVSRQGYSWSAAWADYDNDGDLDLVVSDGNNNADNTNTPRPVALYRNDGGNQNNWCIVSLQGVVSNRSAFGAKVRATATINGEVVTQLREINGHNSELRAHFGLGNATVIDTLQIEWPSGGVDQFQAVQPNRIVSIVEGLAWAGFPKRLDDWVDTGSFLGWIYVGFSPHVYVLNLNKYIYLPEEYINSTGAWAFVGK